VNEVVFFDAIQEERHGLHAIAGIGPKALPFGIIVRIMGT